MTRIINATVGALVVALILVSNAVAGPPSTTSLPSVQYYLTVADVEMMVSNPYGFANLRQRPTTASRLLEKLPQGTKVVIIEQISGGRWSHVKVNGKDGYIETKLLK